jgi:hypothetical protein
MSPRFVTLEGLGVEGSGFESSHEVTTSGRGRTRAAQHGLTR